VNAKILPVVLSLLVVLGAATAYARGAHARVQTKEFNARVDNRWLPLTPGSIYVYSGVKDGKQARDVVRVTHQTKTIAGAPCVAVRDRLYLDGRLAERTTDWYTQDRSGNVWYFGEQTAELDKKGRTTSTEGSWQAGVNGAKPGIFMPAEPRVGKSYRQEFYKGHAEDHFRIIGIFGSVTPPPSKNALLTKEWTPLEPDVLDHKLYVRGIGTVVERSVRGSNEYLELESVRRGS
jgi:hypothetical protein